MLARLWRGDEARAPRLMSEPVDIELALQCGAAFSSADYSTTMSTLGKIKQQRDNGALAHNKIATPPCNPQFPL